MQGHRHHKYAAVVHAVLTTDVFQDHIFFCKLEDSQNEGKDTGDPL